MQKALSKLLKTGCFSIRQRLCISAEEPASATVQDKTIWFGFFVPHSSLKGRREGMSCFYPFWTLKLVIFTRKQPQMLSISPHSPRLELSESLGDISCQCMCPALINANESCVHEEKGQPLCLWGIGFHSKELGSNLTYNFNWVLRPRPVIGSPLQTPKSTTQQHILWHYQLFRIISQGTNPPSFGGLFSPKSDSKLWHKRYQTYYIMITVNGKN